MASRNLGSLTIDLIAKTGGFTEGLSKAERELKTRAGRMEATAKKVGHAIGVGLAAGAGTAAAAFGVFVRNTIEAEKVQAQLASRLKDTGGVAMRSLQQLNEQAERLQKLTVFDDESIAGVQAMMLTFKDIRNVQLDKAVESVLDLSTAMGVDLNSAALQLGKALNDPVAGLSALSRAGVQFTADQKALIKSLVESGDKAKAQDLILAELESQMGTAAEAARNTLGGSLQALGNAFNNLLEGDTGSDGVRGSVDAINSLTDALNDPDVKRGVDNVVGGISSITAETLQGIGAIQRLISAHNTLFGIMDKRGSGEALSTYSDKELQNAIALLGRGKAKAQREGDQAGAAKLQNEITALIRENTRRLAEAGTEIRNRFSEAYERASLNFNPNPTKPAPASPSGRRSGSSGSRRAKADSFGPDIEAMRRLVEQTDQAKQQFEALAATLSGPLAEAEYRHKENLREITELGTQAERSSGEIIALKELEIARFAEESEAIRQRLEPGAELLKQLQFEHDLIGMSNAQRQTAIQLRGMDAESVRKYGAEIAALNQQIEAVTKADQNWRQFQGELSDTFVDLAKNIGDAGNILKEFADSIAEMITRSIAESWAENITSWFKGAAKGADGKGGSTGGGWGEWIGAIFGALFGGGKASGGWAAPNRIYEVNERGLEMATVGGRDYMLTGSSPVHVTPNSRLGGGLVVNQQINVPRNTEYRSAAQVGQSAFMGAQRAAVRNR